VPAAPTDLTASEQSASAIRLIWSSSGETLTGFKIERSLSEDSGFMQIAVLGRDSTSHVDESLDESTTYYYRLRAYEGTRDSGYSNVASATTSAAPLGVPAAPTDLRAEDATSNSIVLYWLDNSNGTSFQIERSSSARAGFSLIASTPAAATSYTDNGLNSATTYFYRVRAVNSVGSSGYSNVVSGTTLAAVNAPAAPTHLSSRALTGNAVELTWVDNSQDETGFKVERSNFEQSGFTQIQIVQRDTRHFTDTELNPRTTYFYRVRATNADATTPLDSGYSNTSRATTSAQASLAPTIDTTMMSSTASPDLANTAVGNKENAVGCNWIYSFVTQTQDFVCAISALYFDIQSVAGRTIHSATLLLYPHPNLLPADLNSTLELKAIASPWSSQTMTWNNWRETGQVWLNPIVRRSPPATAAAPIEFDITDIMRNWAGGVRINRGLLLANSAADYLFPTATLLRAVGFESMEFNTDMARKPQLVIDYQ
jgi:fibronectin type 3 domain-containing protein